MLAETATGLNYTATENLQGFLKLIFYICTNVKVIFPKNEPD